MFYYDVVASICTETCRTESLLCNNCDREFEIELEVIVKVIGTRMIEY